MTGVHLSGRLCDRRFGCASVVLDDARARANANSIEFNTAREKLLQNTFGARILVTYMLLISTINMSQDVLLIIENIYIYIQDEKLRSV